MCSTAMALSVIRWIARLLALGMFLLWGAFFLEHLQEWFLHPAKGFPPFWVWLMMLAHLGILVGLVALWKWEIAGSSLAIAAAIAFFGSMAIKAILDGHRYFSLLVFLGITILPPLLILVSHFFQAAHVHHANDFVPSRPEPARFQQHKNFRTPLAVAYACR